MFTTIKNTVSKAGSAIATGYGNTVNAVGNNIPGAGVKTYGNNHLQGVSFSNTSADDALKALVGFKAGISRILNIENPAPISHDIIKTFAKVAVANSIRIVDNEKGVAVPAAQFNEEAFEKNVSKMEEVAFVDFNKARSRAVENFLRESEMFGKFDVTETPTPVQGEADVIDVVAKTTATSIDIKSVIRMEEGVLVVNKEILASLTDEQRHEVMAEILAAGSGISVDDARGMLAASNEVTEAEPKA